MNTHITDELPRLLRGEARREVVHDAAIHLRACDDCLQELVSAVLAHASLTSAQRFAPDVVGAPRPITASQPADQSLPDLSAVFAQVRSESSAAMPTRSRRPLYLAAAVAAGLIVGGGAVALANHTGSSPSGHTIALAAYQSGHTSATATLVGSDDVKVNAASLPSLDATHRYEVWLTNDGRTQMQPIGWIASNGKANLTVPQSLLKTYSDIEVSVQSVAASTYTYSGTSVLRGSYTA